MRAPTRILTRLAIAVAASTPGGMTMVLADPAVAASTGASFGAVEGAYYSDNTSLAVGSFTEACPIDASLPSHPHDCGQLAPTVDSFNWTPGLAGSATAEPTCATTAATCTFRVVAHGCPAAANSNHECQPYPEAGSYQASYTWEDPATGVPPTVVATQATVSDAPLIDDTAGRQITVNEGQPLSGSNFTWSDSGLTGTYSASTVDWGDGSPPDQVSPLTDGISCHPNWWWCITGSHVYSAPGAYHGSVTITDDDGQSVVVRPTIVVTDAPLSAVASPIAATEGQAFSSQVATFSDGNPNAVASDFTATVDWKDGSPSSAATVTADPSGGFDVNASHTYAKAGTYDALVTINDHGGASAQATSTATVADAPLGASGVAVSATEGSQFTGPVAIFTDGNPGASASDFAATINWGDGTTQTAGTVSAVGGPAPGASATGGFQVNGTHLYPAPGRFTVTVIITDSSGATATVSAAAQVVEGTLHGTAIAPSTTEAATWSGRVLTFTDTRSDAAAADFTAKVDWGDSSTSPGTVVADPSGGFEVDASHTYTEGGSPTFTVTATDNKTGRTLVLASNATVADLKLTGQGMTLQAADNGTVDGTVATFNDADPSTQTSDYTATIDWGDGHNDPGTVTVASGHFVVSGSHTYNNSQSTTRLIVIKVRDNGGGHVTISSPVTITKPPPPPPPPCLTLCWPTDPVQHGASLVVTVTLPKPAVRLTAVITYRRGSHTMPLARLVRRDLRAGDVSLRIPLNAGALAIARRHHTTRVELTVTVTTAAGIARRHRFVTLSRSRGPAAGQAQARRPAMGGQGRRRARPAVSTLRLPGRR